MYILILLLSVPVGFLLNAVINHILKKTSQNCTSGNTLPVIVTAIFLFISYIRFGISIGFLKSAVLAGLLVIISFVDFYSRTIPDYMVISALAAGIIFSIISGASIVDMLLGMLCGGGILLLLSLIPNSIGGGDIKLMFALGSFLGLNKTLYAVMFGFIAASVIGLTLIIFRFKSRKDYIPFGPFLSLGSFISLMIFI